MMQFQFYVIGSINVPAQGAWLVQKREQGSSNVPGDSLS